MTIVFGSTIKAARKEQGLQQQDLADRCNFPLSYIITLETGMADPELPDVFNIAKALGMPASQLVVRMEKYQDGSLE